MMGCHNSYRRLNEILQRECFDHKPLTRQECECPRPFKFHTPKDADSEREWKAKLKLMCPPKKLYVCSHHFIDKQPTCTNPFPQLYLGYANPVKTRRVLVRCQENFPPQTSTTALTAGKKRKVQTSQDQPKAKQKRLAVEERKMLVQVVTVKGTGKKRKQNFVTYERNRDCTVIFSEQRINQNRSFRIELYAGFT